MRLFLVSILLAVALIGPVGFAVAADIPASTGAATVKLDNPLGPGKDKTDVPKLVGVIIKGVLSIIGALVLLMFIWGTQAWITAAGNPEKIKTGWKTMVFASLGALIVFFSYLFLNGVLTYLGTGKFPGE